MNQQELTAIGSQQQWAGKESYYYEEIDSTNLEVIRRAKQGAPHGTLVAAGYQHLGRGRRGRSWEAEAGESLLFSLLLRPDLSPEYVSGLTLVMALSVAQASEAAFDVETGIKWPNDLVLEDKKFGGILTEMRGAGEEGHYLVIGVGINLHQKSMTGELAGTAVSLRQVMGRQAEAGKLLSLILGRFEENYGIYLQNKNLGGLLEEYNSRLVNRDRQVRVLDPQGEFEGIARGANADGELLVELPDGRIEKIYAGEVSVRGMYGYVL